MTTAIFPTRQYKCFDHSEIADFVHVTNCIIATRLPAVDHERFKILKKYDLLYFHYSVIYHLWQSVH